MQLFMTSISFKIAKISSNFHDVLFSTCLEYLFLNLLILYIYSQECRRLRPILLEKKILSINKSLKMKIPLRKRQDIERCT